MTANSDPIIFHVVHNCQMQNVSDWFIASFLPAPSRWEKTPSSLFRVCSTKEFNSSSYRPPHHYSLLHSLSPLQSLFVKSPTFLHAINHLKPVIPSFFLLPHSRLSRLLSLFQDVSCINSLNHNLCLLLHWFANRLPSNLAAPCVNSNCRNITPTYTHE